MYSYLIVALSSTITKGDALQVRLITLARASTCFLARTLDEFIAALHCLFQGCPQGLEGLSICTTTPKSKTFTSSFGLSVWVTVRLIDLSPCLSWPCHDSDGGEG